VAHALGIKTNATMLYGHIESPRERVDHLLKLRELQDRTGGFQALVPLPYHAENNLLGGRNTTGVIDIKVHALSRILLDNFDHIKAFWIMTGTEMAQILQRFGVDDLDGTVIEEKITHSAGATTPLKLEAEYIRRLISSAGRTPVERDTLYHRVG
jgi:aminodeoxyfutalosine synthase